MDLSVTYSKTGKGMRALAAKSRDLPSNVIRILSLIDGQSSISTILAQYDNLTEQGLDVIINQLESEGYVKILKISIPGHPWHEHETFSTMEVSEVSAEEFFKVENESERKAHEEAEAQDAELRIKQEAEARAKAELEAREAERKAQARVEAERKAKEEAEAKARVEAEKKALEEAEARARAEDEFQAREAAKRKARDAEAENERKTREEAERKARAKVEAERKAREEAEARAREEAEAKAREETEHRIREEAETKAKVEAEKKVLEEAEARARTEDEFQAREAAERKARDAEAENERKTREEAERKARARVETERKAREEAEAKAKEESEAKAREETEHRIREEAKAKHEAELRLEERLQAEAFITREEAGARRYEAPVNILKLASIATFSAVAVVLLLLISLPLVNLSGIISIEKLASDKIHEPVTVSSMHVALLPTPYFVLKGIRVGSAPDVKIGTIRVVPVLGTLFQDTKTLQSIDIDSLAVPQDSISKVVKWMEASRGPGRVRLGHIVLRNVHVDVQGLQVPTFDGKIKLDASDQFEGVALKSTDSKLSVEVIPRNDVFAVTVTASSWHPPIDSPLEFSELNAKAVASRKGVNIVEIGGKLYGGAVNGSGTVRWDGPWAVAGEFELSNSSLSGISQAFTADVALTGSIDMKATFSAKANKLHNLLNKPNIKANFVCRDGSIGSIDLARIVVQDTRGSTENMSRFDKLTGSLDLTNGSYQFRKINLAWGNLSASGNMDITANKNLSGKINAEMILQSRQFRTRLDITGNLKRPQLK